MSSRVKTYVWVCSDSTVDQRFVSGGTKTNFYYNINGAIPVGAKNLTVELISFTMANNAGVITNAYMIKLLIDFGVQANQSVGSLNNYTVMGVIPLQYPQYYYDGTDVGQYNLNYLCEYMTQKQPKYNISYPNNLIHVTLVSSGNLELTSDVTIRASLFCLEFEYEI